MRSWLTIGTLLGLALLATPAFAQEMGTLVLDVDPDGAEVYVDGVKRGTTPLTPFGLPAGKHQLVIQHPHRLDVKGEVVITAGQETRESIVLRKAARLELDIAPDGAEVRVDNESVGFAPIPPLELAPGKHEILVIHPTHEVGKRVVDLRAGEERVMKVVLIATGLPPGETVSVAAAKKPDPWYGPWAGVALGVGTILAGSGTTLVLLDEEAAGYSLIGVGGAALITGIVFVATADAGNESTTGVAPTVFPDGSGGGLSFAGTF